MVCQKGKPTRSLGFTPFSLLFSLAVHLVLCSSFAPQPFSTFFRPPKQTHIDKVSKLLPVVVGDFPHVFAIAAGLLVSLLGVSVATLLAKATAKTRKF